VGRFRQHIDDLSGEAASRELGLVSEQLAQTIEGNVGSYVTRQFRAFTDPKHVDKIRGTAVWNEMADSVRRNNPDLTPDEVDGLMTHLADRDPEVAFATFGSVREKRGQFLRRKELPDVYRAFLGEVKDPAENYLSTVSRLSHDIETHRTFKQWAAEGEGKLFFDRPTGRATVAIPEGPGRGALAGKYTVPEVADVLTGHPKVERSKWALINGVAKLSATVGSEMTHVRNFISWPLIRTANGSNPLAAIVRPRGGFAAATGFLRNPAKRDFIEKATRYGILGHGAHTAEALDYARDVERFLTGEGKAKRAIRRPLKKAIGAYRGEDDFWKADAAWTEFQRYRKALPDASEDEIWRRVADIVNDTTPTPHRGPKAVERARRNPIFAPFVSFFAEIPRNTVNTGKLAVREMFDPNPAIRKIGAQRAAGLAAALSIPSATVGLGRLKTGTTAEDEQALRRFVYPWNRHSQLFIWDLDRDTGEASFVDLSFMDPYAILKRPVIAALGEASALQVAGEAVEPFVAEELFTGKIFDVLRNSTPDDWQVYRDSDPLARLNPEFPWVEGKIPSAAGHVAESFQPGTLRQVERTAKAAAGIEGRGGRVFNLGEEAASFAGVRLTRLRLPDRLESNGRDFFNNYRDIRSKILRAERELGRTGPDRVRTVHQNAKEDFERYHQELLADIEAARKLGLNDDRIRKALEAAGIGKANVDRLMRGWTWDVTRVGESR
jgi:hypothetical protein